jgi:hypothetical protein
LAEIREDEISDNDLMDIDDMDDADGLKTDE